MAGGVLRSLVSSPFWPWFSDPRWRHCTRRFSDGETAPLPSIVVMDPAETFCLDWYFFIKLSLFFSPVEHTFGHKYLNVHSERSCGMDGGSCAHSVFNHVTFLGFLFKGLRWSLASVLICPPRVLVTGVATVGAWFRTGKRQQQPSR